MTGLAATEIFGAGIFKISLTSDCINNRKAEVSISARGGGMGLGAFLDISHGDIEVEDSHSDLQPNTFNGYFQLSSVGWAVGVGYGAYAVAIGTAGGMFDNTGGYGSGHGKIFGYGLGAIMIAGSSTVNSFNIKSCGCE